MPGNWFTVTIDSRGSRGDVEHIQHVREHIASWGLDLEREFTTTVGDEIQALTADPGAVATLVERLATEPCWIGIGVGAIDRLRAESRLIGGASGERSRAAIERAKRQQGHGRRRIDQHGIPRSWPIAVEGPDPHLAALSEYALGVVWRLAAGRTERQREVIEIGRRLDTAQAIATELGIAAPSVSRLRAEGYATEVAALACIAREHLAQLAASEVSRA